MSGRRWVWAIYASLVVLAVGYALQVMTPLRLTTDVCVYLTMASRAADGGAFYVNGEATQFPPGYPAILSLLDRVGIACSQAFVLLNLALMATGLFSSYVIYRRGLHFSHVTSLLLLCLAMLSSQFQKYAAVPLSDLTFFGSSMTCLAMLTVMLKKSGPRFWVLLAVSTALAAASTCIRAVGMMLFPAVIAAAVITSRTLRDWLLGLLRNPRRAAFGAVVVLLIAASALWLVSTTRYFRMVLEGYAKGHNTAGTLGLSLLRHVGEWGEIVLNMPKERMPEYLGPAGIVLGMGCLLALAVGIALRIRTRDFGHLETYLLCYALLIFAFPLPETRLWLPVTTLAYGYATVALTRVWHRRKVRALVASYLLAFCLVGVAAVWHNTRISLSGRDFPDVYGGDVTFRATYNRAFGRQGVTDDQKVDDNAVRLLMRYEPRYAKPVEYQRSCHIAEPTTSPSGKGL